MIMIIYHPKKGKYTGEMVLRLILASLFFQFFSCALTAQFRLSTSGAISVLNSGSVTPAPPSSTINYASVTIPPPSTSQVAKAGMALPVGSLPVPNDRNMGFAYESPSVWWAGYFNYQQATQCLYLSGSLTDISIALAASVYINNTANFIYFQYYNNRRATMSIRANDQSPVAFPPLQIIDGNPVQFNAYTPAVSSYSIDVPLRF